LSVIAADVDLEGEGSVKCRLDSGKVLRESDFSKISQAELKHEA